MYIFLFLYSFNVKFCLKADGKGALPTKISKYSMEKLQNDSAYTALKNVSGYLNTQIVVIVVLYLNMYA